MKNLTINNNLIITNVEQLITNMEKYLGCDIDLNEVLEYINGSKNVFYYVDCKLNSSMCEQPESLYLWIDTGLKKGKRPIFISLVRRKDTYEGYYFGDADWLAGSMIEYNPVYRKYIVSNLPRFKEKYSKKMENVSAGEQINITKIKDSADLSEVEEVKCSSVSSVLTGNLYEEVYNNLLINNWKSIKGLERYIKIIGCRAEQLVEMGKQEYFIMNHIKSIVVKTGLLDKFAADILMLYKWNVKQNGYVAEKMITSKRELISEGFEKDDIERRIKTINFFDENEPESLKGVSAEDFDLNTNCLKHILEQRRDRFPEEVLDCTDDFLAGKLRESLSMGLKIMEHDVHYAKPSYSAKNKAITWYMPFHVHKSIAEKPELVFAIRMDAERMYYEVKTVLPYNDEIADRITALSLYGVNW